VKVYGDKPEISVFMSQPCPARAAQIALDTLPPVQQNPARTRMSAREKQFSFTHAPSRKGRREKNPIHINNY
jgi:hypothetical protein